MDAGHPPPAEVWLHEMAEEEIQPDTARLAAKGARTDQTVRIRASGKLVQAGGHGIETEVAPADIPVTEPLGRVQFGLAFGQVSHQCLDLVDQVEQAMADPVPLQQGEFGIVLAAALLVTKGLANLEDGATARREQPLHGEFRGSLQVQRGTGGLAGQVEAGDESRQAGVGDGAAPQQGGFDLQHAARLEEGADAAIQAGPAQ